jgi:uncharacterized membrane protein
MDLSIKSILLLGAVLLTGLSAGLFFAWSVSVIPGTQKVSDAVYLQTMQSINRAILNPAFFVIFFGSAVLLSVASIYEFSTSKLAFSCFLAAAITYFLGTVGVTGMGNVPLNDQLDALDLLKQNQQKLSAFRSFYETKWNKLHAIRTAFSVLSFILALVGLFISAKQS